VAMNITWNVRLLFERIRDAISHVSVLLVDETVLANTDIGFIVASIYFIIICAFTSMKRTEAKWHVLTESARLELVRGYTSNAPENETAMELATWGFDFDMVLTLDD